MIRLIQGQAIWKASRLYRPRIRRLPSGSAEALAVGRTHRCARQLTTRYAERRQSLTRSRQRLCKRSSRSRQ